MFACSVLSDLLSFFFFVVGDDPLRNAHNAYITLNNYVTLIRVGGVIRFVISIVQLIVLNNCVMDAWVGFRKPRI